MHLFIYYIKKKKKKNIMYTYLFTVKSNLKISDDD